MTNVNKMLNHIQIVMVNTTLPANIGSAARAMHTMGLQHLCVIDPKLPVDDSSYAHAAGATHILDKINIQADLASALMNSQLVFAASSRSRSIPRPVVTPSIAAQLIEMFINTVFNATSDSSDHINSKSNIKNTLGGSHAHTTNTIIPNISILFGREDRGLTNEELALADYHIQIDANPNYPVLNVAAAVQVISSFLYAHFTQSYAVMASESAQSKPDKNMSDHIENDQIKENSLPNAVYSPSQKPQQTSSDKALIHFIRQEWDEAAITQQQQQKLNQQIIHLMQSLELANKNELRLLPQRLARLTSRVQLDVKEYQMLAALIGKLQKLTLK